MIKSIISDPETITYISILWILSYYIVSGLFIENTNSKNRIFKRNGALDIITSLIWSAAAFLLIASLIYLCTVSMTMKLSYLIIYYFLFIFLFAFIYGLVDWHFPNTAFENIQTGTWDAEIQYLLISIQTQTTLGYSNAKPKNIGAELLTSLHALLGIFFMAVFISLSVNHIK